ncbi:MAG: hypothetical protein LC799_07065, partial [Actinobacteria bacterium]|nr:hypothetical protein [Actinomycetota bacterium]
MTGDMSEPSTETKAESGSKFLASLALLIGLLIGIVDLLDFIKSGKLNLILTGLAVAFFGLSLAAIWKRRTHPGVLSGAVLALGAAGALCTAYILYNESTSTKVSPPPQPNPS